MHHHLEIILPPTENVKATIEKVLAPYDERYRDEDEDGDRSSYAFWDFWVIGGRWSGEKIMARSSPKAMAALHKDLSKHKVTVSGVQWGKQTISPAEQIPLVDSLWRKHFPDGGDVCPIFDHYNERFIHSKGEPDICLVKDIPPGLKAARVMIAAGDPESKYEKVTFMIQDSYWNGVNYVDSKWDTKVLTALEMAKKRYETYRDDYKAKVTPKDDWLCVTVDYHS